MIEKETAEVFVNFLEAKGTIFPNEKERLRAKNSFIEFFHVEHKTLRSLAQSSFGLYCT